jgi:hypothetical protein
MFDFAVDIKHHARTFGTGPHPHGINLRGVNQRWQKHAKRRSEIFKFHDV